jgi:hypothetical protein
MTYRIFAHTASAVQSMLGPPFVVLCLCVPAFGADPPTPTVPADLLAAEQAVELDKTELANAQASVANAQAAVDEAQKALKAVLGRVKDANSQLAKDKSTAATLSQKYYGNPTPQPDPQPDPKPDPKPLNPDGKVATQCLIIFPGGTVRPWEAKEVSEAAAAGAVKLLVFDSTGKHAEENTLAWIAFAKKKGLPWCGLTDGVTGIPLYEGKPTDVPNLISAIQAFGAKPPKAPLLAPSDGAGVKKGRWVQECVNGKCGPVWKEDRL